MENHQKFKENILVFIKKIANKNIYFEVFFSRNIKDLKVFDWQNVIYLVIKENDNNSVFYPRTIIDGFERENDRCLFSVFIDKSLFFSKKIKLSKNTIHSIIQTNL